MKLNEALKLLAAARVLPVGRRVALACGFEPLHLKTFLEAHFAARFSGTRLELEAGVYGDLEGNVARAAASSAESLAVVMEWGDLDFRLGMRSVGAWSGPIYEEIVRDIRERLGRLADVVERFATRGLVAICPPTIPSTIAGWTAGAQHSAFELALEQALFSFLERVARSPRCSVVHAARLETLSPAAQRHDPRMEIAVGFPYRVAHASALAELLLALLFPPSPKKALITDLDDTLWAGLVGDVGVDQVSFTQAAGSQIHGLYQLVLRQLADMGVLLGVASKNDPEIVRAALAREDLWLKESQLFPVHASWGPKSESVSAILRSWNLAATDVVFVDDSAMELDEVRRVHPGLECLVFPRSDAAQALHLFETLRDLFGRSAISRDDALRSESLKAGAAFEHDKTASDDQAAFVRKLGGVVIFRPRREVDAQRALQLLNKTNQFNLNGLRLSDAEFSRLCDDERSFVLEVAYSDRYGPLGTVGVAAGRLEADRLVVDHWVLSCRAFSRRIEHHMLHAIIDLATDRPVHLAYQPTARSKPLQLFLEELGIRPDQAGLVVLPGAVATALSGNLPHEVAGVARG